MAGHVVEHRKRRERESLIRISEVLGLSNLIGVQTDSYQWFLDKGLHGMFEDILPIDDFQGNLSLEFTDYELEGPEYIVEEARVHDANYSTLLYVTLRLTSRETGEIKSQRIFFGDFPLVTGTGTFVISGAGRVIVSQSVCSSGVYFYGKVDKNDREGSGSTVTPNRGTWLRTETDVKDISYVRIDRTRKIPLTILVRILGFGSDDATLEVFGDSESLHNTIEKDLHKNTSDSRAEGGLKNIYKRLRPDGLKTAGSSRSLSITRLFDPRRYDLANIGRYGVNKKLDLKTHLLDLTLTETLINPEIGEIIIGKGTVLIHRTMETLGKYIDSGLNNVTYYPSEDAVITEPVAIQVTQVLSPKDPECVVDAVDGSYLDDSVEAVRPANTVASMSYFFSSMEDIGNTDGIDHLGNRRIRSVGELLQNQFRIGSARMERVVRERMSI